MGTLCSVDDGFIAICPITKRECYAFSESATEDGKKELTCAFWDDDCYCQISSFMAAIERISEAVHGGWGKNDDVPHIYIQADTSISGAISTYEQNL